MKGFSFYLSSNFDEICKILNRINLETRDIVNSTKKFPNVWEYNNKFPKHLPCHMLPSHIFFLISAFFKTRFVATASSSVALFDAESNVFPRRMRARLQVVNRDSLSPERAARKW